MGKLCAIILAMLCDARGWRLPYQTQGVVKQKTKHEVVSAIELIGMEAVKLRMVTEWRTHRPEEIAIMGGPDHTVVSTTDTLTLPVTENIDI